VRLLWAAVLNATLLTSTALAAEFPGWAYPPCTAAAPAGNPDAAQSLSVAGSGIHFTRAQLRDRSSAPDWFPLEHGPPPAVVAGSQQPKKLACGFCHLPDGNGRPENAKLAGLPPAYIITQVKAFHAAERRAAQADWLPITLLVNSTAELTEEELAAAADYFSHQQVRSFVHVVESDRVPAHTAACYIFAASGTGRVSLGSAIVEMPIDIERFERRDPHTTYVAYVPKGSIERGRLLARTGAHDRTQPCALCHGPDLRGGPKLPGPPLAGRFASYLFRQLYGFQSGARGGDLAQPMRAVVARLTQKDMIDLAAYAASLNP
jgi:cytochrome c553